MEPEQSPDQMAMAGPVARILEFLDVRGIFVESWLYERGE